MCVRHGAYPAAEVVRVLECRETYRNMASGARAALSGHRLNRESRNMASHSAKQNSILLVDDDRHILDSMAWWLSEKGFLVEKASDIATATARLQQQSFDLLISDIRLGHGDGFELLSYARQNSPQTTVILVTGFGTVELAIEAIRAGAFDLLTKPLIDAELEMSIERALRQRQVLEENRNLKAQLDVRFGLDNIIGHDAKMRKVYEVVEAVADTKATVLITGESGTGKSMLARAIHRRSSRRDKPFVEMACGALPESLLESELFGHVAGAFTGAVGDKQGRFLQADKGTIFLDEIATATQGLQVKLLRVLQDFEFEPVGGTKTHHVDTRVILATNENLQELVADGRLRQDLYYRINVINIELPALRERISDVPQLAQHFVERVCEDAGRPRKPFSEEALSALSRYTWPGNVRELQNVVERAILLGRDDTVRLEDLPTNVVSCVPNAAEAANAKSLKDALEAPERRIILEVLELNNWNRNATAEYLGINRTTLYKKMKRLGLETVPPRRP